MTGKGELFLPFIMVMVCLQQLLRHSPELGHNLPVSVFIV